MTKVVLVCTSAHTFKDHPTGVWLEECASPFYLFKAAGFEVTMASPLGGPIPIDGGSLAGDFLTDYSKKFLHDPEAMGAMSHSVKLSEIDVASIDGIFFAGGHGTCVDFVDCSTIKSVIETMTAADKVVSAVCHGVNVFVTCKKPDGTPFVAGKKVTGFTDSEERMVQLDKAVPFLLEEKLVELGSNFEKAAEWNCKVSVDGKLVTGQNPQSSEKAAEEVVKLLKA